MRAVAIWNHIQVSFPYSPKQPHLLNMTHFNQPKSLSDLRKQIENGSVPTASTTSALAFLDLTQKAIGEDFHDCSVLSSEVAFSRHFPSEPDENLSQAFGDATLYRRCRESLHRHVRLAGLWSDDPFTLLNRLAKEHGLKGVNRKMIENYFPGLRLSEITRDRALLVDRALPGQKRSALRSALATMDRFRADPRVLAAGFLGLEKIGSMPRYHDEDKLRVELPTDLATVLDRIPVDHALRARRAFELAVDMGLLEEHPSSGTWPLSEADALCYHETLRKNISDSSARIYLVALISLLRAANPVAVPDDVTADRVRRPDRYTPKPEPKPDGKKKDRQSVHLPPALEAEVSEFARALSASRKRVKSLRRLLGELVDAGYDIDNPAVYTNALSLLDTHFAGYFDLTVYSYRSVFHTFLLHTNRLSPWPTLLSRAKLIGSGDIHMSGLRMINTFAETRKPAIGPAEIDTGVARDFLMRARKCREISKCLRGLKSLDILREKFPDLLPGPDIGDLRDWVRRVNGEMPEPLETALRADAEGAGYRKQGVRARIVAVRALYALTPDKSHFDNEPAEIPWRALIEEAQTSHPKKLLPYRAKLLRLASQRDRRWIIGWRNLQAQVVAAGISRADNSVETLMDAAIKTALEPWQLGREWAWVYERSLRPDLCLKWARIIACFDALHDVPAIAEIGLLHEERLGPMPSTGSRLKNAHFPLPRRFESVLEGETKQVLEAAHFVWRGLRDFGVYSRSDDPAPSGLVSETHLDRVNVEQSAMTAASARLHLTRIHDWRESWPNGLPDAA